MLSFKPDFSLSSFTLMKRLFSSSSLSAIRVVSSEYLRLLILIFLPAILISACHSSSQTFHMMYTTYKLNKQADNIQPCCIPLPILNQSVVLKLVLTVASRSVHRFLRRRVRCSSTLISLGIFHSLLRFTVKGFCVVNEAESRCFSGIPSLSPRFNECWQIDLWFLCHF